MTWSMLVLLSGKGHDPLNTPADRRCANELSVLLRLARSWVQRHGTFNEVFFEFGSNTH